MPYLDSMSGNPEREAFKAIPLDTSVFTNRLSHSALAMEKYLAINDKERQRLEQAFLRGILLDCLSSNKVFKIDAFKKTLQEMKLTVPTGALIPILEQVSSQLIDLFGYCIAPINYGGKRSLLDESSSGLKELVLVSILSKPEVKEANSEKVNTTTRGRLFWTICYLFLNNGCEKDRLENYLMSITGDRIEYIRGYLDEWERGRYIVRLNTIIQGTEMTKYEIGLRSFMEIGYKNIVSFLCTMTKQDYSDELAGKWLNDTVAPMEKKEKKEKKPPKETTGRRGRPKKVVEEEEDAEIELEDD